MALSLSDLLDPATTVMFFVVLGLMYLYMTWPYGYFKSHGIPGPTPVPFFGNWFELGRKTLQDIDTEFILKYGKVFGCYNGWDPELIVSDIEMIKEFTVKQHDHFMNRRRLYLRGPFKQSVFDKTDADWKRSRSIVSPFFSSGKLKLNTKRISRVLKNFIKSLNEACESSEQVEGKNIATCYTLDVICSVGFGVEVESLRNPDHPFVVQTKLVVQDFNPKNPWFLLPFFFPGIAELLDYFNISMFKHKPLSYITDVTKSLIAQKQQGHKEAQEFVTALVRAHEEFEDGTEQNNTGKVKGMTEEEIVGNALVFIAAGYETTATSLGFLLYELALNEDCQQALYDELKKVLANQEPTYESMHNLPYLDWCVDETLRLHPSIIRMDRRCSKSTTIGGLNIPKGMILTAPVNYLHHLEDIWPEPYQFDPLRFSPEVKKNRDPHYFMPFGAGPRQCVGMRLAILELKMAAATIIQNFKLVKTERTVPVVIDPGTIFPVAKDGLWFSVEKRELL